MSKSKDLYLLVDGTHADPSKCEIGADNELRHGENGVPVALDGEGNPQTVSQGAADNKNEEAAKAGEDAAKEAEKINADNEDALKAEAKEPKGAVTAIDPATGKSSDDDLLLTTDDLKPKAKEVTSAKAKTYKNREVKAR